MLLYRYFFRYVQVSRESSRKFILTIRSFKIKLCLKASQHSRVSRTWCVQLDELSCSKVKLKVCLHYTLQVVMYEIVSMKDS